MRVRMRKMHNVVDGKAREDGDEDSLNAPQLPARHGD